MTKFWASKNQKPRLLSSSQIPKDATQETCKTFHRAHMNTNNANCFGMLATGEKGPYDDGSNPRVLNPISNNLSTS